MLLNLHDVNEIHARFVHLKFDFKFGALKAATVLCVRVRYSSLFCKQLMTRGTERSF